MIVSYISLGIAGLSFLYGVCRDVSQRKQDKKNSDKINSGNYILLYSKFR